MATFRIQATVVQPGYEAFGNGLGALTLDFEDEAAFNHAREQIMLRSTDATRQPVFVTNDSKETISWEPKYYHSMWAGPYNQWQVPDFRLPPDGAALGPSLG